MTRRLRALAPLLGLFALAACQSPAPSSSGAAAPPHLSRILENRELRVGLTGAQPPLNMTNRRGEIIGLEVDLVRDLASAMGLEARLVPKPFAELLPALEANEVDLVVSGLTITPERNARVAFAGPYLVSGKTLLTRSQSIASAQSSSALDDPSRTYAALAGSTGEQFVKNALPRAKLVATPDYDSAVRMLLADQVDALVTDLPFSELTALRYPDAGLSLGMPLTIEPLGIALPAGDPLFVNLVENYLETLESTGILTQLKARWLSDGSWVSELP